MSKRSFPSLVLVGFVLLSSQACVRVSSTRFDAGARPTVAADSVRVFATRMPASYEEIAVLRARRFLASDGKTLASLRKRAAQLGANGIILVNAANAGTRTHTGTGVVITGTSTPNVIVANGETTVDQFERAIAIRWTRSDSGAPNWP